MERARRTLFYPAFYLTLAGLGFTFLPQWSLTLFGSNGHYDLTFVRMSGLFILGLAALVIQTIRLRLDALYPTLVAVRVLFCAGYVALYLMTRDPFFLVVFAMVAVGMIATAWTLRKTE